MSGGSMFSPPIKRKLERLSISAPLGLRFWDTLTQRAVSDGLVVTISPQQNPRKHAQTEPNFSGIYVFHRLPGLGEISIPDAPPNMPPGPIWSASDPQSGFILEVTDLLDRFLPFQLTITELSRGVFNWICPTLSPLSPLSPVSGTPLPHIPLFSSPNRSVPVGMAVVRADLCQLLPGGKAGLPAAWAVLSVVYKSKLVARGLASREGSVLAAFPYPPPVISSTGPSGLLSNPVSINQQTWDINLECQFYPANQIPDSLPERPDLCEALSHPPVSLLETFSPLTPLGLQKVRYAQETIVKTVSHSELFFTNP